MRTTTTPLILLSILILLAPEVADAREIYPARIPNGTVNNCSNCHVNPRGAGDRNDFGTAFEDGGLVWTADLALADSDGDGFTNGAELLDPDGEWSPGDEDPGEPADVTKPGDPDSHPPEGCQGAKPEVDIGGACVADADCGEGGKCRDAQKGGYCTVVVEEGVRCCPDGSTPFDVEGEGEICLKDCVEDADCRDGEEAYQSCDEDSVCWGCWIPPVEVGVSCDGDDDCGEGGTCLKEVQGYVFPGGHCAVDWVAYCCPAGTEPVTLGEGDDEVSYCMLTCGGDGDCREDEDYLCDNTDDVCWPLDVFEGGEGEGEAGGDDGNGDGGAGGEGEGEAGGGGTSAKRKDDGCATAGMTTGSLADLARGLLRR